MDDRGAPVRRPLDRGTVEKIIAIGEVKASDIMAQLLQMIGDRAADVTAMSRDQNPHQSMIERRSARRYPSRVTARAAMSGDSNGKPYLSSTWGLWERAGWAAARTTSPPDG